MSSRIWMPTDAAIGSPEQIRNLYELDREIATVCTQMQKDGILFDRPRALEYSSVMQTRLRQKRDEAEQLLGEKINLGSGRDLAKLFFGRWNCPVVTTSEKTGAPGLDAYALETYMKHPTPEVGALAKLVLEYRSLQTIDGTFIRGVQTNTDGRVHATWSNYKVVSGRFGCSDPNLMNMPRPENDPVYAPDDGYMGIRSLYLAPPGRKLVYWDASQLEMRIAAYASGDSTMIGACEGGDLHSANARIIFGEKFDPDTYKAFKRRAEDKKQLFPLNPAEAGVYKELKALRTMAKTAAFAICYGAQVDTVWENLQSQGLDIPRRNVVALFQRLRRVFKGYYEYQARNLQECIRTGYAFEVVSGRRRYLSHAPPPNEVSNFPIQGGAAGFMNRRLYEFKCRLLAEFPTYATDDPRPPKIVAQIHDALAVETDERDVDLVSAIAPEIFEAPILISGRAAKLPIELEVLDRLH